MRLGYCGNVYPYLCPLPSLSIDFGPQSKFFCFKPSIMNIISCNCSLGCPLEFRNKLR